MEALLLGAIIAVGRCAALFGIDHDISDLHFVLGQHT